MAYMIRWGGGGNTLSNNHVALSSRKSRDRTLLIRGQSAKNFFEKMFIDMMIAADPFLSASRATPSTSRSGYFRFCNSSFINLSTDEMLFNFSGTWTTAVIGRQPKSTLQAVIMISSFLADVADIPKVGCCSCSVSDTNFC
jgi:hypothetical protein